MKKFTLFFNDGRADIIEGDNFYEAQLRSGNFGVSNLDFWSEGDDRENWKFTFSKVLQKNAWISANTCKECFSPMEKGEAIKNTICYGEETYRGRVGMRVGPAKKVEVMKCTKCGHSYEI